MPRWRYIIVRIRNRAVVARECRGENGAMAARRTVQSSNMVAGVAAGVRRRLTGLENLPRLPPRRRRPPAVRSPQHHIVNRVCRRGEPPARPVEGNSTDRSTA